MTQGEDPFQEELSELRKQLETTTQKIVELIEFRVELARKIGELKKSQGAPILDLVREEELVTGAVSRSAVQDKDSLRRILREVISLCRQIQSTTVVAVPLTMKAYSEEAALSILGSSCRFVSTSGIESAFEAVAAGLADFCVTPYESTSQGAFPSTLDSLVEKDLRIVGEVVLGVRYFLVSREDSLESVKTVVADPEGAAACRVFLSTALPWAKTVFVQGAGESSARRRGYAFLSAANASRNPDFNVLAEDVQDDKQGATRFIVAGRAGTYLQRLNSENIRYKTTLVFTAENRPGFLSKALGSFSSRGINLTMIVSRPLKAKKWEYVFVIDLDCVESEKRFVDALTELKEYATMLRILGTYPELVYSANGHGLGK
ncbi:MAG: prephenate dehydratase domain-containing protein [Thermoprotei archaeon]